MESASRTVAAVILDLLAEAGITKVFGIPGVHNLGFWNAIAPGRPEIVGVRHEQSCVYAADGVARATGKLSVALTTTGPGAANTLGAFGEAAISGSPILVISSETPMRNRSASGARGILHEMSDQASLFRPLSKKVSCEGTEWILARSTTTAEEAISAVVDFLALLVAPPTGAGYIGVPADVLNQTYTGEAPHASMFCIDYFVNSRNEVTNNSPLLGALKDKKKIAIWAGGGATQASEEIKALSEHLGAPIFTSFAGRGIGAGSPHYITLPIHEPEVEEIMASSDALIVLGSQLDGMNTKNWSIPFPETVCVIDANPAVTLRNVKATLSITTDQLNKYVTGLMDLPAQEPWINVSQVCDKARARIATSDKGKAGMALVQAIDNAWPAENYIVCDMAISGYWTGVYSSTKKPRHISYPVGWGTLGFGLPASIGPSSIGYTTLVVCGDGGIAFGLGELATVAQEKLPVTILLHDDGGYGMLRFDQQVMNHPERGVDLFNPDWGQLASAFGLEFIEADLNTLEGVLTKRAKEKSPAIVLLRDSIYPPCSTSPRWGEKDPS